MSGKICDYIISFLIGLTTGIVSSGLVTRIFRNNDNERDKNTFIREMNRYISNMNRLLFDIYRQASIKSEPKEAFESVKSGFYYKPNYEERFKLNNYQKKKIEAYYAINEKIDAKIRSYQNIKSRIDGVHCGDYPDPIDELENRKWASLIELGFISFECHNFLNEPSEESR